MTTTRRARPVHQKHPRLSTLTRCGKSLNRVDHTDEPSFITCAECSQHHARFGDFKEN